MKRVLLYLIVLGGVMTASPRHVLAQDSLLTKDFLFLKQSDAWLTNPNAAGLTRLNIAHLSDAKIDFGYETGGFVNYYEAAKAVNVGAGVESFYRLTDRIVMYGKMGYHNFAGKKMSGSAFVNPSRMPFDIVESTTDNSGNKHRDTYTLTGAVGADVHQGIAVGAKVDFTAANYAKYKDLRHKNNLMDLALTAGIYAPLGKRVQVGANYFYRRSTEQVRFSIYGNADLVYKSIIDYGAFFGKTETFGEKGYTEQNREMPLFNEYHGVGIQAGWDITSQISWHNHFGYAHREGYYGKKSSYTVSHNQFDGKSFVYDGRLTVKTATDKHLLDMHIDWESTTDYNNSYREVEDAATSARYYEYYTPVKLSKKTWTEASVAYTGYYGVRDLTATWMTNGGVEFTRRKVTAYDYPYYRTQDLRHVAFFAQGERNFFFDKSLLSVSLAMNYQTGSGDLYNDGTMAPPSDKQVPPAEMTAFLHREYQYLTAPQYGFEMAVKYAFVFPKTRMKTYAKAAFNHLRTTEKDDYLEGQSHSTLSLTVGCTF